MIRITRPRPLHICALAVLLVGVGIARAQDSNRVDFRLNEPGVSDASNQLGARGYNRGVIPNHVANSANLYITGNVTAGRSFQAFSPVQDASAFSAGLGTSTLYDFRRDSVSLDDVLAGRTPMVTTPYYSRQRTTTSLGTISAGFDRITSQRADGIYALPDHAGSLAVRPFGVPYVPEFAGSVPSTSVGAGQLIVPIAEPSLFLQPLPTLTLTLPAAQTTPWFGLSAGWLLPAEAQSARGETLPPGMGSEGVGEVPPFDAVAVPDSVDLVRRSTPSAEIRQGGIEPPGEMPWQRGEPTEAQPAAAGTTGRVTLPWQTPEDRLAAPPATSGPESPRFAPTGTDLYQDMVSAFLFATEVEQRGAEIRSAAIAAPAAAEQYERDLSVLRQMLDQPIETFAGSADTPIQNLIRQAEELVRQGKYYQAKTLYEQALIFDRTNPLLLLGQGHAMLAAGEYYSAALKLSRAVELFNAVAYFKFDLRTFITEPDLLEKRRADLEERLERKEDYRLRFLLGYAEYYSDLAKYGLPNLKLAAEQAPEHSGIVRLNDLLTRHGPASARQ